MDLPPSLPELFDDIAKKGKGVIMTMGKGGVGKTTIATELARFLAEKGNEVLLATTDPAAHLDFTKTPGENTKLYLAEWDVSLT